MDRKALLLYLQSLRDLEVARYKIRELRHNKEIDYNSSVSSLPEPDYSPVEGTVSDFGIGGTIAFITIIIIVWVLYYVTRIFFAFWLIITIFCSLMIIKLNVSESNTKKQNEEKEKRSAQLEKRNSKLKTSYYADYSKWMKYCDKHESEINRNLNDLYSLNIIPKQFRNLESIIYIYDYMSTSRASLENTLYHTHIEQGIQEILRVIQKMCNEISHQLYVQNVQNMARHEQIMNSNKQMLNQLKSINSSSAEASQYARLAADYGRTCAYFQTADYLRRNFYN